MLNLINIITSISALISSSALDFFNKEIPIGSLIFKMWMIIIVAVAFVLLVILSALLIAVTVKEKKLHSNNEENNSDETSENSDEVAESGETKEEVVNSANNEETNVEDNVEETAILSPVVENSTEDNVEETHVEDEVLADTDSNTVDAEQNENNSQDEIAVDVVENEENNETVSEETVVTYNTTDEDDKEAKEETMEKQIKDETSAKVVLGKLNYYLTESGWYFRLDANNGQELFVSYSYTTQDGATKGFETFAKAVLEGTFVVSEDKNGRFRYILNKKYQGPNYKTRVQCENAIASVKKFSQNYRVNVIEPTEEDLAAFAAYLENLKKAKDIDMDEIAKEEANTPKSGAFEIEEVDGGYRFYLYANNRQILYTSNIYASPVSARNGIDAFKKAVYGGVVIIEKDKFSNYRYILRNSTTVTYAGESYDTEASARKSFESVKRFVKSANIVPFKKKVDGEDAE